MTQSRKRGVTRREFMKTMAVLGAAASAPGLLMSCSSSSGATGQKEQKTLYFDHSHLEPDRHDFYLVVGSQHIKLERTTQATLTKARESNRFLKSVADGSITHHALNVTLPADSVQLCHVRHIPKGMPSTAAWKLSAMFIHLPKASLEKALGLARKSSRSSLKSRFYTGSVFKASTSSDATDESALIGPPDSATAIVFCHPEVLSMDSDSAAHVTTNIIGQQSSTDTFSQAIQYQGQDWSSSQTLTNPATGAPFTDSSGRPIQMPVYSDTTLQYGGAAVNDTVYGVKQDPTLYANVSNVTDTTQLQGKLSTFQDGVTCTTVTQATAAKKSSSFTSSALSDVCTGGGYRLELDEVEPDGNNALATLMCTNSYIRHLGMFVRYLDANGNPIPLSAIPQSFFSQYSKYFFSSSAYDSTYDKCLKVIGPEYVVFGIPVKNMKDDVIVPIPPQASRMQVIGNTLGHGDNQYNSLGVGIALTGAFDLAVPSLFLCMGACASYAGFMEKEDEVMVIEVLEVFMSIVSTTIEAIAGNDAKAFVNLGIELGQKLLEMLITKSGEFVAALSLSILSGEVLDAVPFVGAIMNAIACAATAAQITQTSVQCLLSPWNYANMLSFTHAVTLTINHDPLNPEGFPSVATYFLVTAVCQMRDASGKVIDSTTPIRLLQQMPGTTRTAPLVVTIPNVPYGGYIALTVGFYSPNNWLAGYGSLSDGNNTQTAFSITITQNQVPLINSTTYSHKEKTTLDASGNHVWTATTTAPRPTPLGQCGQTAGQLCQVIDITDSNTFASAGYAWQSASASTGQTYYIGNVSTTDTPQSSSLISSPLTAQPRIVYDLMGGAATQRNFYLDVQSGNIIRQIRLSLQGVPSYDPPGSNTAWGKLNFSSDALLLHPNGKLVSINAALSKIEVVTLLSAPTTDANAPLAAVYAGKGIRQGLLDGPLCAALTPKGEILILETANNRIQAFDTGGNPVKVFNKGTAYFTPLNYSAAQYNYLDMATEYTGYIYLLCYQQQGSQYVYFLDIYTPDGSFLSRTSNFIAAKITVSFWRDVFAANLEALRLPNGNLPVITEPSVSRWIPSTPPGPTP